jgi:hypothetical protein
MLVEDGQQLSLDYCDHDVDGDVWRLGGAVILRVRLRRLKWSKSIAHLFASEVALAARRIFRPNHFFNPNSISCLGTVWS